MFAHEKLHVYSKALTFAAAASAWNGTWDKKHAFVDQLFRATESILLNLGEAARQRGTPARLQSIDCAIGSSLECAACLDIARVKELWSNEHCHATKAELCEITKMLVGLRKAWTESTLREEPPEYSVSPSKRLPKELFHHERLDVYHASLQFIEWCMGRPGAKQLSNRLFRRLDEASTSIALNIAEGNGRYAELDHHRFLQMAQSAAVKAAVYLDLSVERRVLSKSGIQEGKELLRSISAMLAAF